MRPQGRALLEGIAQTASPCYMNSLGQAAINSPEEHPTGSPGASLSTLVFLTSEPWEGNAYSLNGLASHTFNHSFRLVDMVKQPPSCPFPSLSGSHKGSNPDTGVPPIWNLSFSTSESQRINIYPKVLLAITGTCERKSLVSDDDC